MFKKNKNLAEYLIKNPTKCDKDCDCDCDGEGGYGSIQKGQPIQDAYQKGDGSLSQYYHNNREKVEDYHNVFASDVLKSIIFGGLDGIITTFAIICSCYASNQGYRSIIILGFANIMGASISMGHGDYFSEKTEQEYINDQYNRENWEMTNYPKGEIDEMVEIYEKEYQVPNNIAVDILTKMSIYKKLFIDHMMVLELGLLPPDNSTNPLKNGLFTFLSFIFFGSIPLVFYILTNNIIGAISSTIVTLGLLGWMRAYFTKTNKIISCFVTIINGCFSATAAYFISYGLDSLLTK